MIAQNPDDPETRLEHDSETRQEHDPRKPDRDTPDSDLHAPPDGTLGGYFREHNRPPAFEGPDGEPYTVSPETEQTADLSAPYAGFLVFPRWARSGLGVVGHVETPTLLRGRSRDAVLSELGRTPLFRVQELLGEAVRGRTGNS